MLKKVICLNTGIVYNNMRVVSETLNIPYSSVFNVVNKKGRRTTRQMYFEYYDPLKEEYYNDKKIELAKGFTKKRNYNYIQVKCLNNGVIYKSVKQAAKELNVSYLASIYHVLSGRQESYLGLRFCKMINGKEVYPIYKSRKPKLKPKPKTKLKLKLDSLNEMNYNGMRYD